MQTLQIRPETLAHRRSEQGSIPIAASLIPNTFQHLFWTSAARRILSMETSYLYHTNMWKCIDQKHETLSHTSARHLQAPRQPDDQTLRAALRRNPGRSRRLRQRASQRRSTGCSARWPRPACNGATCSASCGPNAATLDEEAPTPEASHPQQAVVPLPTISVAP